MARFEEITFPDGSVKQVRSVDAREIRDMMTAPVIAEPVAEAVEEVAAEVPEGFPKDFPGASAFERSGIGHHAVLRMSKDELIAVKGIGEKLADEILKIRSLE